MDPLDKFFQRYSYRFPKGYPDINNDQDILLLEDLLKEIGLETELTELKKLSYDILTDEAKNVAEELIKILNISQNQIQPASSNNIVIYDDFRSQLIDKLENNGNYGLRRHPRQGKFKKGNVVITFKPDRTSGEYYELKPQQLGITLDKEISLDTLRDELIAGIQKNKKLNDEEYQVLLYLITNENKPSQEIINQVFSNNRFYNELLKNLGETLGALIYGKDKGASYVSFPSTSNYPGVDYILTIGKEKIEVNAKTSKGLGNIVKLSDLKKQIEAKKGTPPEDLQRIIDIVKDNTVTKGSLKLIEEFGSSDLKKRLEEFYDSHPEFPNLDYEGRKERITLEKEIIKELNQKFNLNEIFNEYTNTNYVKYELDPFSLEQGYSEIPPGKFNVSFHTKNSPGHDSDKIGLAVRQIK